MKITIPVAVEAPTLAQVEDWLVRRGWRHYPDPSFPTWARYADPTGARGVSVPLRVDALDYPRRIAELIEELTFLTGIAPADIVAQMRGAP